MVDDAANSVEIRDGDTGARAKVESDGSLNVKVTSATSPTTSAVTVADGADVALGARADAAWASGNGTVISLLKAVYGKLAATLGFSVNAGVTDATTLRVITASDGPLNTNLGATTDAAIVTDANGSVSGKLRGIVKLLATGASVRLPAKVAVSVEKTRDSSTTAYTAGDVVNESASAGTKWTFANVVAASGDTGSIVGFRVITDQKTCTARFRMHFYRTAPTDINDNAVMTLLYANATNRLGTLDSSACMTTSNNEQTSSTGAEGTNITAELPFVTSGSTSLFGVLETLDAFTPASGQKVTVELLIRRD